MSVGNGTHEHRLGQDVAPPRLIPYDQATMGPGLASQTGMTRGAASARHNDSYPPRSRARAWGKRRESGASTSPSMTA